MLTPSLSTSDPPGNRPLNLQMKLACFFRTRITRAKPMWNPIHNIINQTKQLLLNVKAYPQLSGTSIIRLNA